MENTHLVIPARGGSKRRRAIIAFGSLLGVGALLTTAAFTDVAYLNLNGNSAFGGGGTSYNIQVVKTDPTTGAQIANQWQEADDPAGVPLKIDGSDTLFPGSADISVDIPVRNASPKLKSGLTLSLAQLPDVPGTRETDPNFRSSLRFDVSMPATHGSAATNHTNKTFAEVNALALGNLDAGEVSKVTLKIRLLDQATSGAPYTDDSLQGKAAYLQAVFNGTSIN
ncbi:MAG: hypothetical protein LBR58_01425 [Propionibacteriaceae bacterium]|jgi:hypothetical protein|nr:hypothetical protein [Propionibacteriaceae bacterium]